MCCIVPVYWARTAVTRRSVRGAIQCILTVHHQKARNHNPGLCYYMALVLSHGVGANQVSVDGMVRHFKQAPLVKEVTKPEEKGKEEKEGGIERKREKESGKHLGVTYFHG